MKKYSIIEDIFFLSLLKINQDLLDTYSLREIAGSCVSFIKRSIISILKRINIYAKTKFESIWELIDEIYGNKMTLNFVEKSYASEGDKEKQVAIIDEIFEKIEVRNKILIKMKLKSKNKRKSKFVLSHVSNH